MCQMDIFNKQALEDNLLCCLSLIWNLNSVAKLLLPSVVTLSCFAWVGWRYSTNAHLKKVCWHSTSHFSNTTKYDQINNTCFFQFVYILLLYVCQMEISNKQALEENLLCCLSLIWNLNSVAKLLLPSVITLSCFTWVGWRYSTNTHLKAVCWHSTSHFSNTKKCDQNNNAIFFNVTNSCHHHYKVSHTLSYYCSPSQMPNKLIFS